MTGSGKTSVTAPPEANDALFAGVYDRLKAMASRQLARVGGGTLNTTALVHELYLKLSTGRELPFEAPSQFFDYAAQAMRHILVDRARGHLRLKRGGDMEAVDFDVALASGVEATAERIIELDDALQKLEREDARAAHLVALHYFAGLTLPEIAELKNVTTRTLNRDWRFARAFLYDVLG
jgi:RNA polymerase sigma factor (TIGR02999 family)